MCAQSTCPWVDSSSQPYFIRTSLFALSLHQESIDVRDSTVAPSLKTTIRIDNELLLVAFFTGFFFLTVIIRSLIKKTTFSVSEVVDLVENERTVYI